MFRGGGDRRPSASDRRRRPITAGLLDGERLLVRQDADDTELVSERVPHDRPVDRRRFARVRMRPGIERRRLLQAAADVFDLPDGGVDVAHPDVDV
jgi:hypothetical protein